MNFFLKAQIEFKETHSLTFQEIERNFKELKKENYGTYIYTIFLSFFFLFLILSFLNLGVIVFLGILYSLFRRPKRSKKNQNFEVSWFLERLFLGLFLS